MQVDEVLDGPVQAVEGSDGRVHEVRGHFTV